LTYYPLKMNEFSDLLRRSMAGIERETAALLIALAPTVGMADEVLGGVVSLLDVALSASRSRRRHLAAICSKRYQAPTTQPNVEGYHRAAGVRVAIGGTAHPRAALRRAANLLRIGVDLRFACT